MAWLSLLSCASWGSHQIQAEQGLQRGQRGAARMLPEQGKGNSWFICLVCEGFLLTEPCPCCAHHPEQNQVPVVGCQSSKATGLRSQCGFYICTNTYLTGKCQQSNRRKGEGVLSPGAHSLSAKGFSSGDCRDTQPSAIWLPNTSRP